MDNKTKEERSANMARIRSKNTKPEIWLRKKLFARGYRYRLHPGRIEGKPDLWLKKYNCALFVHGCFWHHHPGCRYAYSPKSRQDYWNRKFETNRKRDRQVSENLEKQGIRQLIIWECTIREMKKNEEYEKMVLDRIEAFLQGQERCLEIQETGPDQKGPV